MKHILNSNIPRVVCIVGVDGTGKTCHAIELVDYFEKMGHKSKYFWFGAPYILSYPFMLFCRLLGLTKIYHLPNNETYSEHEYYRIKPIAFIWPIIQLVDVVVISTLRVFLLALFGYTIVCDRYVCDTLVGLMDDLRDYRYFKKTIGRAILRLRLSSTKVFLLEVSDSTAFRRKGDIPNIEYLARRRTSFRLIQEVFNVLVIDANKPFKVVQKQLTELA